jgi:hypothetical protein
MSAVYPQYIRWFLANFANLKLPQQTRCGLTADVPPFSPSQKEFEIFFTMQAGCAVLMYFWNVGHCQKVGEYAPVNQTKTYFWNR